MASSMTKSALQLARLSLQIAQASLPVYAHKFSPKRYTQPQLFSILVLRPFFKTDYRGIVVLLAEWAELRSTLGLKQVPNYSTLCYAQRRLCTQIDTIKGGRLKVRLPNINADWAVLFRHAL